MFLFFLVFALGFIQGESRERKASLVILPPLVLGYDELSFERDDIPTAYAKARRTKEESDKLQIKPDIPPEKKSENPSQKKSEYPPQKYTENPPQKKTDMKSDISSEKPTAKPTVNGPKREPPKKPPVKKGKPLKKVVQENKNKLNKMGRIGPVKLQPPRNQPATRAARKSNEEPEKPPAIKPNKLLEKPEKLPENKLTEKISGKTSDKSPVKPTVNGSKRDPPKKPPSKEREAVDKSSMEK